WSRLQLPLHAEPDGSWQSIECGTAASSHRAGARTSTVSANRIAASATSARVLMDSRRRGASDFLARAQHECGAHGARARAAVDIRRDHAHAVMLHEFTRPIDERIEGHLLEPNAQGAVLARLAAAQRVGDAGVARHAIDQHHERLAAAWRRRI